MCIFFCNFQTLCHKEKARNRALRSKGVRTKLQHQGGWSSGCTWLGTKLFAPAPYNGAKIILKEPNPTTTTISKYFSNSFFFNLSACEINFMGAKAVFNRNQIRLQKMSEPFLNPYEEVEQQIQRIRKAIRSIGKPEKTSHNGLIAFLKSYSYLQTPPFPFIRCLVLLIVGYTAFWFAPSFLKTLLLHMVYTKNTRSSYYAV